MTKKVLIIDDDANSLKIVTPRLKEAGYAVVTASDGEAGLKKVQAEKPDLIILDIAMPEMDGFTFVQELKKVGAFDKTPIIVLTAKDEMQDIFEIEGVKDYIAKPFNTNDLLGRIKKLLKES
ncbi:MAG: hypothetical protein A2Z88_10035 [Omnitrophica WOR_2 bacterium GWA2_47_8]|nr:MAG: hypothetical protein A2Z88_10035 [Omnitrophica WOR_2 bacterium GWA2_47_8]